MTPVNDSVKQFDDATRKKLLQKLENVQLHSNIVSSWINDTSLNQQYSKSKVNKLKTTLMN